MMPAIKSRCESFRSTQENSFFAALSGISFMPALNNSIFVSIPLLIPKEGCKFGKVSQERADYE